MQGRAGSPACGTATRPCRPRLDCAQVWACPSFHEPRVAPRGDARNLGRVINDLEIVAPRPAFPLKARRLLNPLGPAYSRRDRCASMTSTSGLVLTSITVQFDLSTNITADAGYVDQAIQAASALLPKNLPTPPPYKISNPADAPILIFAVHSGGNPIQELDQYANILIRHHPAGLDRRDLRGDVTAQLQHRQSVALALTISIGFLVDDAIVMDRKHRSPHRSGKAAARGRPRWRGRDRIHHSLHHPLARRGLHSGSLHGGCGGTPFPPIRDDDRSRDLPFRLRVADADPMMCVGFLTPESHERQGRFSR